MVIGVTLKALGCPPATGDAAMALSACVGKTEGKAERRPSTGSERIEK
jgi:hypothetical protein